MSIYAVTYAYTDNQDLLAQIRPQHRAFLGGLYAAGVLLASGPVSAPGTAGALIIVRAESPQGALDLLAGDPFLAAEAILERQAVEWNPIYGPWEAHS
ncbi:YciI family protein [Rarobacter incanus]|uniref:YCII-related domain-containing protein n=1 Tax=Rarobacter incanus TaxID=153494 RepID=A0A542SM87_9MICO|nr:YciI family protein [Rarobacter incanus]TQK75750.1 hypothetical protein FB389_0384 [Rarobacter incanus]